MIAADSFLIATFNISERSIYRERIREQMITAMDRVRLLIMHNAPQTRSNIILVETIISFIAKATKAGHLSDLRILNSYWKNFVARNTGLIARLEDATA